MCTLWLTHHKETTGEIIFDSEACLYNRYKTHLDTLSRLSLSFQYLVRIYEVYCS